MSVPVTLSSTMSGAPTLSSAAGTVYAIMKWALPQLGWTLVNDVSANSACTFQNSAITGSGNYVKIQDITTVSTKITLQTSVAGGADNAPTSTQDANVACEFWKSDTTTAVPWQIIGDERSFIFRSQPFTNNGSFNLNGSFAYFGDINSFVPNDKYAFTYIANAMASSAFVGAGSARSNLHWCNMIDPAGTSYLSGTIASPGINSGFGPNATAKTYIPILRNATGVTASGLACLMYLPNPSGFTANNSNLPSSISNKMYFETIKITESGFLRGTLRGMYSLYGGGSLWVNSGNLFSPRTWSVKTGSVVVQAALSTSSSGTAYTALSFGIETALAW